MSVDIERTVLYDVTIPECADICLPRSRTIVTAGDDGFIEVENQMAAVITDEGMMPSRIERCYLTPPMLLVIADWLRKSKPELYL